MSTIYQYLLNTLKKTDTKEDLQWFANVYGIHSKLDVPVYEVSSQDLLGFFVIRSLFHCPPFKHSLFPCLLFCICSLTTLLPSICCFCIPFSISFLFFFLLRPVSRTSSINILLLLKASRKYINIADVTKSMTKSIYKCNTFLVHA